MKGQVIVPEEGVTLQEGMFVEVIPVTRLPRGGPAALLEVWNSDVPDEGWDVVERAVEELDHYKIRVWRLRTFKRFERSRVERPRHRSRPDMVAGEQSRHRMFWLGFRGCASLLQRPISRPA